MALAVSGKLDRCSCDGLSLGDMHQVFALRCCQLQHFNVSKPLLSHLHLSAAQQHSDTLHVNAHLEAYITEP